MTSTNSSLRETIEGIYGLKTCIENGLDKNYIEKIINSYLKNITTQIQPLIVHTLGVPGSGKSSFIKNLDKTNSVLISFDSIMEDLPAYKTDKLNIGAESAFRKWELPAREIGYELLFRAVEQKKNIIFEHSGARADHINLLERLKKDFGYRIKIDCIDVEARTAHVRVESRERFVPPEYINVRMKTIRNLLDGYRNVADEFVMHSISPNIDVYPISFTR